jgi:hypothetical protein
MAFRDEEKQRTSLISRDFNAGNETRSREKTSSQSVNFLDVLRNTFLTFLEKKFKKVLCRGELNT